MPKNEEEMGIPKVEMNLPRGWDLGVRSQPSHREGRGSPGRGAGPSSHVLVRTQLTGSVELTPW